MNTIEQAFEKVRHELFYNPCRLDYEAVTDSIIDLCSMIIDREDKEGTEDIWYLGESTECCMDDLIVGAYWHYYDWHAGQYSQSYLALCRLGEIYSPNMVNGPEPDSSEEMVKKELDDLASAAMGASK